MSPPICARPPGSRIRITSLSIGAPGAFRRDHRDYRDYVVPLKEAREPDSPPRRPTSPRRRPTRARREPDPSERESGRRTRELPRLHTPRRPLGPFDDRRL